MLLILASAISSARSQRTDLGGSSSASGPYPPASRSITASPSRRRQRYTFDVAHDVEKADADIKAYMASRSEGDVDPVQQARMMKIASPSLNVPKASWTDVFAYFSQWKNTKVLLGTTTSWFFLVRAHSPSYPFHPFPLLPR